MACQNIRRRRRGHDQRVDNSSSQGESLSKVYSANLNESYFTDRQDRYLHFSDQQHLSQYCFDFINTVCGFSFKLETPRSTVGPHSVRTDDYSLLWPTPDTHPHRIHHTAERALSSLQNIHLRTTTEQSDPQQVSMFPLIQAGQFNIRDEETTLKILFEHLDKLNTAQRPLIDLTSGYFGLYREYQDLILRSANVDCRIVASAPRVSFLDDFNSLRSFSSGERILRIEGHLGTHSGGVHSSRATVHERRAARRQS